MSSFRKLFTLFFLPTTFTAAAPNATPKKEIIWGPCQDINGTLPVQCGNLAVPLDYTDTSANTTLGLELLKVPAIKGPKRGSILFNFGGPGIECRKSLASLGDMLHAITGGEFDLIAHDPRGTANTLTFRCFNNETERLKSSFGSVTFTNASDVALGTGWAVAGAFADVCAANEDARGKGNLIGTAFTARDLMQIVDALGEDGLLRYWGLSYGTLLGATVAAMFPERMDRVVLDGVLNPHEYYNGYDTEMWSDTDATLMTFYESCIANAPKCPLARNNATAPSLEASVYKLINSDIKYHPIKWGQGQILDYTTIKSLIRFALYSPAVWPALGVVLDALLRQDLASATPVLQALMGVNIAADLPDESPFGIHCADKGVRSATLEGVMPAVEEEGRLSRLLGDTTTVLFMACAQWNYTAKERYLGDFQGVKTRNPVLWIGNSFDPATPLRSAVNASSGFEGSVVLEHQGHGHATLAEPSICTSLAIRDYFTNGTMPTIGAKCKTDAPPFSGKGWADIYPALGYVPATGKPSGGSLGANLKRDLHGHGWLLG